MVEGNPLDSSEVGLEAVEVKTGHSLRELEGMVADTTETTTVHTLLALAVADKMSTMHFEPRVAGTEIVDLVNWISSSRHGSAQERGVQAKHNQHGHVVSRELW